jgi:hypothetical protein
LPFRETDPLDVHAEGTRAISVSAGVVPLENAVLKQGAFVGIVLRYGQLYGPGTGRDAPHGAAPVHVDAAAYAALLAIEHGAPGIYNIAEPNDLVATDKARRDLGFDARFRLPNA